MAIAIKGRRGCGGIRGGASGAGCSVSFGASTDCTGTTRLRNRTPPATPDSAIDTGLNVRMTILDPRCVTISYSGDASSAAGSAKSMVIRSPTAGFGG